MANVGAPGRILPSWNWKTAVLSGCFRAALFAGVSSRAGQAAAFRTALLEVALTVALAGFQGALIQAFRRKPTWGATLVCAGAAASVAHPAEWLVHTWAGSPNAATGILFSLAYTLIATRFSVLAMHRGAFIAGPGARSIWDDLRQAPALLAGFAGLEKRPKHFVS